MFKKIALSSVILISNAAFADCIGPEIMGKCYGTQNSSSSSNNSYKSNLGNNYQYDLGNPIDRHSYSTDVDAQIRDKTSSNRSLDFNMGQNGGGIYDDY